VDTGRATASPCHDAARRRKIAADNDDDDDDDHDGASVPGDRRDTTSSLRHQHTLEKTHNQH